LDSRGIHYSTDVVSCIVFSTFKLALFSQLRHSRQHIFVSCPYLRQYNDKKRNLENFCCLDKDCPICSLEGCGNEFVGGVYSLLLFFVRLNEGLCARIWLWCRRQHNVQ